MNGLEQIRSHFDQLKGQLTEASALGGAVLMVVGFNPQTAIAVPSVVAPTPPSPGEVTPTPTPAEECQAEALHQPASLSGRYQTYNVPNDNHFEIKFSLPALPGCDAFGRRKVTVFQQKQEQGLRPPLKWTGNGLSSTITTNKARHGDVVLRAAHLCSRADAYGDFDKKHHIGVRPAVKITWQPTDGTSASAIFSGPSSPACK